MIKNLQRISHADLFSLCLSVFLYPVNFKLLKLYSHPHLFNFRHCVYNKLYFTLLYSLCRVVLSKITRNQTVDPRVRKSTEDLIIHVKSLHDAFDSLTKDNQQHILDSTNGTGIPQKRELKTMIKSLPIFSGELIEGAIAWPKFQFA